MEVKFVSDLIQGLQGLLKENQGELKIVLLESSAFILFTLSFGIFLKGK